MGGFREDTLSKLQYRHVKKDIEKSITPIHVRVDIEIHTMPAPRPELDRAGEAIEKIASYNKFRGHRVAEQG